RDNRVQRLALAQPGPDPVGIRGVRPPSLAVADARDQRLGPGPEPDDVAALAQRLARCRVADDRPGHADDERRIRPERDVERLDLGEVQDILAVGLEDLGRVATGHRFHEVVVVDVRPAGPLAQGMPDRRLAGTDHADEEDPLRRVCSHPVMVEGQRTGKGRGPATPRGQRLAPAPAARAASSARCAWARWTRSWPAARRNVSSYDSGPRSRWTPIRARCSGVARSQSARSQRRSASNTAISWPGSSSTWRSTDTHRSWS